MCGRFYVQEKDLDDFAGLVNQVEKHLLKRSGEIFPGDYAPVITPEQDSELSDQRDGAEDPVHALKWGFPSSTGKLIINARAETITEKPLFRIPFASRRCLIPARGFFEWKDNETGKRRIKFYIAPPDSSLIYLAGLYWFFKDKEGLQIPSFTIITTEANEDIKPLHDRMPVVVQKADKKAWLYDNSNTEFLMQLMLPAKAGHLILSPADQ